MKITKENLIAGIIAVVAFVAIICELIFGGVSTVSIAAAIKDVTGIIIDVIVFLLAFRFVFKKEQGGFRGQLEETMKSIEKSYAPLIKEHIAKDSNEKDKRKNQEFIRYDIAKNIDALFGAECNDYIRFLEIKANTPDSISFYVRQKFFGESFNPKQIATDIKGFCDKKYNGYETTYSLDKDGAKITVSFDKIIVTKEDVESIVSVIDDVLFLFIAECKI